MALSGLAGCILLATLPLQAAPAAGMQPASVHDGASEAVQAWLQAVNTGDAAAIERLNASTTVAYPPTDEVLRGHTAIAASYRDMFQRYQSRATVSDAHWLRSGDILVSWGLFTLELQPRQGGDTLRLRGRFSDVAQRTPTGWRYVIDHAWLMPKAQ